MVIADRLKALREQKNMSRDDIEKRTGLLRCFAWRTATRFQPSTHLKKWLMHWTYRCTCFFMMARNHLDPRSRRRKRRRAGEVRAAMRRRFIDFADEWTGQTKAT